MTTRGALHQQARAEKAVARAEEAEKRLFELETKGVTPRRILALTRLAGSFDKEPDADWVLSTDIDVLREWVKELRGE